MGIVIGLAGAHRVGKSSICEKMESDYVGLYRYASTDLTSVLEKHKVTAVELQKRPIHEFLKIQHDILNQIIKTIQDCRKQSGVFVVDRTPIDALAYLWSNFNATDFESLYFNRTDSKENIQKIYDEIELQKKMAYEACQDDLAMIFLIQPGIEIVEKKGKALPDKHYQEQLNRFMLADLFSVQEDLDYTQNGRGYKWCHVIPKDMTNLDKRVLFIDKRFTAKIHEELKCRNLFKI